jgi:flagellar hook-associated protein 1 FlgK
MDFCASDIKGMADFKVNQSIIDDPSLIATKHPGEAVGSGSVASAIADLQSSSIFNEGTAHEYYQSLLTQLGDKVQEADFNENSQKMIIDQLKNQRDAVTGVSMDEEMTQMVQYQQAYSAAAKMITTVDQMMNTVIQMV